MNLDATDRALLLLLSEDARVSHRSLARTLGIAQGTVTNRVRRLEQEGVIEGYRVALNPTKLGWSMTIMAGLRIQKGRMIDVQQKISADPRVFAVYDVTGDWWICTMIESAFNIWCWKGLFLDGVEHNMRVGA